MQLLFVFCMCNFRYFQFRFRAWINFKSHAKRNSYFMWLHCTNRSLAIIYWWNVNGISCSEAADGKNVCLVSYSPWRIIAKFISICSETAHNRILLFWNCEHFINWAFQNFGWIDCMPNFWCGKCDVFYLLLEQSVARHIINHIERFLFQSFVPIQFEYSVNFFSLHIFKMLLL